MTSVISFARNAAFCVFELSIRQFATTLVSNKCPYQAMRSLGGECMKLLFVFSVLVIWLQSVYAEETVSGTEQRPLRVVIPFLGDAPGQGPEHPLVDVIRQWGKTSGRAMTIERFPFKRSLMMAANGEADFHFPLIKDQDASDQGLPFAYSSTVVHTVNFVLYTRRGEDIDLSQPEKYRIATHGGHGNLLPFPVTEDHTIEGSLRKLDTGRIDAFIFADSGGDPVLLDLGLMNIERRLYKVYDVHAVISHDKKGGEVDEFITEATKTMSRELLGLAGVDQPYHDWQVGDDTIPALVNSGK